MTRTGGSILLIDGGDLASLVAAATQPDPSRLVLWHLRGRDAAAPRRADAVREHAEVLGTADLVMSDEWTAADGLDGQDAHGLEVPLALLQAAIAARRAGAVRIVWPAQVGPDPDAVARAVDLATLVTDLVDVGTDRAGPVGTVAIDLPLVDLDDEQVLDLADDCGAPLHAFWPCDRFGSGPCEACASCARWRRAFDGLGLPWPFSAIARGSATS